MARRFEDLEILREAEELADSIWELVIRWERFARTVVGRQLAQAIDSVGANIAEAFGRYHAKDRLRFLYYARGSLYETRYWLNRSSARQLIPEDEAVSYQEQLSTLTRRLNAFAAHVRRMR